jgi:hypothetical protein
MAAARQRVGPHSRRQADCCWRGVASAGSARSSSRPRWEGPPRQPPVLRHSAQPFCRHEPAATRLALRGAPVHCCCSCTHAGAADPEARTKADEARPLHQFAGSSSAWAMCPSAGCPGWPQVKQALALWVLHACERRFRPIQMPAVPGALLRATLDLGLGGLGLRLMPVVTSRLELPEPALKLKLLASAVALKLPAPAPGLAGGGVRRRLLLVLRLWPAPRACWTAGIVSSHRNRACGEGRRRLSGGPRGPYGAASCRCRQPTCRSSSVFHAARLAWILLQAASACWKLHAASACRPNVELPTHVHATGAAPAN